MRARVFDRPRSTGVNNLFQSIRNDIKMSFDFDLIEREVDRCAANTDESPESESSPKIGKMAIRNDTNHNAYPTARNDDEHMDMDEFDDCDFPWDDKYWHVRVTHTVWTNEIRARFFDTFVSNALTICLSIF